MEIICYCNCR